MSKNEQQLYQALIAVQRILRDESTGRAVAMARGSIQAVLEMYEDDRTPDTRRLLKGLGDARE